MAAKKKKTPTKVEYAGLPWLQLRPRALRNLGIALVAIASTAAAGIGLDSARHSLRAAVAKQYPLALDITPSPSWVTFDLAAELRAQLEAENSATPLSAAKLHRALAQHPWVRSASIRKRPHGFTLELEYREPVLGIDYEGHCCYVDADGIPLDASTMTARAGASCLTLEGLTAPRPPEIGQPLIDPTLQAAAKIAGSLAELRTPLDLDRIAVRPQGKDVVFDIWTRPGGRIIWGRSTTTDGTKRAQLVERARQGSLVQKGEILELGRVAPRTIPAPTAKSDRPKIAPPAQNS